MQLSRLLLRIALLCAPVALVGTTWLYLYPIFQGCAFPVPPSTHAQSVAPFRLLALGDPQLEGDSSLPNPNARVFPSVEFLVPHLRNATTLREKRAIVREAARGVVRDAGKWLEGKRKAIDLWGNDWYLAHIVRSQRWWTEPTHVSALGDLLGSQWITDGEFEKRAGRYWDIVMRGLEKVPDKVFGLEEEDEMEVVPEEPGGAGQGDGEKGEEGDSNKEEAVQDGTGEGGEREEGDNSEEAAVQHGLGEGEKREEGHSSWEEALQDWTGEGGAWEEGHNSEEEAMQHWLSEGEEKEEEEAEQHALGEGEERSEEEGDSKPERKKTWGGTTEVLGADKSWEKRVINIVGNHDVGYAGDINESRIERFEKAFGSVNWDIWFTLPEDLHNTSNSETFAEDWAPPALRLVILNTMNLDTPAWSSDLQTETYSFLNHIITTSRPVTDKTHATILLTHIPLEKEVGVCVDSPYFDFFEGGFGVKEQNMLSDHSTKIVLEGLFGMSGNMHAAGGGLGRRGIVVNGHDHEGCDVSHWIRQPGIEDSCNASAVKKEEAYWPIPIIEIEPVSATMEELTSDDATSPNEANLFLEAKTTSPAFYQDAEPVVEVVEPDLLPKWKARRFPPLPYDINEHNECTTINQTPHIREITLRSMMGEFSGYAGFLSAWFDPSLGERGEWVFEFNTCGVGVQHWWWGVHIIDLILVVLLMAGGVASVSERRALKGEVEERGKKVDNNSVGVAATGGMSARAVSQTRKTVYGTNGTNTFTESEVSKGRA